MEYIRVCDLCGKPLHEIGRKFKIKERWYAWPCDSGWSKIECHTECVKKLYEAASAFTSPNMEDH